MKIFPAIDLMKGKVVRLTQGDPETLKSYNHFGDPGMVARKWEDEGADAIHVIDLDAALNRGSNLQGIEKIVQVTNIPIQVGGGISTLEIAHNLLGIGIDRIILGELAFKETYALTELLKDFGSQRVIVALDHREGEVMVRGWRNSTKLSVDEAVMKFLDLGVKLFLITSIMRDGTLRGTDHNTIIGACNYPRVSIIAAGGVSNLEELSTLKRIGVWGVVVGKALYEGLFKLEEALEIAREGED